MCRDTARSSNLFRTTIAERLSFVTHNPRGNSNQLHTPGTLCGTFPNTTAPPCPRSTRATARPKPFPFNFCRAPPQTPPPTGEKRKVRKWFCQSSSLQSLQNSSLNKFYRYAIALAVFPFPHELGATY